MDNQTNSQPKIYYTVTQEQWDEFVKRIKNMIEGTFHTNDMSTSESEEELCFAVDTLGKEAGLPDIDWDATEQA